MSRLVVVNNVTLDGVMQAPGAADEDTRGGFEHGGWATMPNQDPEIGRAMGERIARSGPMLFGRWTYEKFFSVWPHQRDNPFTEVLNNAQKYVASTTLSEPLPWQNSTLLRGDVAQAVAELKRQDGPDVAILGSGELIRSLLPHGLIDEFVLLVHPLVLGSGKRLFPAGGPRLPLRLADSVTTGSGVTIATYEAGRS